MSVTARRADRLMMACFALQPVAFGAWLPVIPAVKAALGLSRSALALCLLGMPLGTLAALPFAGRIVGRIGARRVLVWGFPLFLACVVLPALATAPLALFLALALTGAVMSVVQLAMNIGADRIERAVGRLLMNTCHGWWSFGLMAGSLLGAGLAALHAPPAVAVAVAALAVLPFAVWTTRALPHLSAPPVAATAPIAAGRPAWRDPAVWTIGAFVLGITMTEGAMADWAVLYLREDFALGPGAAGLGFTVFAAMIVLGRFTGDRLKAAFGALRLARACGLTALAALALLVITPTPWLAYPALAMLGLGVSVGFPLAVTAAAALPGRPAERSVAALSFMALFGFLVGPVVIGLLAEAGGLRLGLAALLPVLLASLVASRALRPARP